MYTVAAMLYPDALATSITLPMEILHAASQMASIRERGRAQLRFRLASDGLAPVTLGSGLVLQPDLRLEALPPVDLLLLPAIWRNPLPTVQATRRWQPMLHEQYARGARICSVGSGSYLLAEAGLLDGRAATTHWRYFEHFRRRYPRVALKTHHLITQSDRLYCAGSVNSIADLMLHIVEDWFGVPVARAIENQFSPEIRRSFRAAAYQNAPDSSHRDELVAEAQQWLQANLATPCSMEALAHRMQLSPRSFSRRFRKATGLAPLAYLQGLRIATAKDLLRHSNLAVGDIAWQVGLQDVSYFSQLFRRQCGMSPLNYRAAARGKLFTPELG
ncbi:MAG: AraC family transcriptional regulator [Halioglobus sp.]|nr:AraC family transcriptional regulator [Halioglobus sp.]